MPTNAINDTGVKYLYDKLHGEIEPIAEAVSDSEITIEGNPLSFNILSSQKSKSTILSLEPIQDLHGYDKPWVGGAGKNLLTYSKNSIIEANGGASTWTENKKTINNVEYTILTDSDGNCIGIKANGTAQGGTSACFLGGFNYTYDIDKILSGCPSGGSSETYSIRANRSGMSTSADDYGNGRLLNDNVTYSTFRIIVRDGTTVNNLIFRPMLRLASIADSSFEPYTNICPITGRTEIGILGCGKNLCTNENFLNGFYGFDGVWTSNNNYRTTPLLRVKNNTQYIGSLYNKTTLLRASNLVYTEWDLNNNFLGQSTSTSITTQNNTAYIRLRNYQDQTSFITSDNFLYQLEVGETATSYSPYTKSNDLTISLGQTVYGGTLDVENGVLVVDKGYFELDGSSDEQWEKVEPASEIYHRRYISKNLPSLGITSPKTFKAISNEFKNSTAGNYDTLNGVFILRYTNNTNRIDITCDSISSVSDWETYLANNPLQICYELATPITINLTPHTINLLKGVNNISTDGDKITLTYRDGSVATLGDLTSAVDNLDSKIDESKILTDTATGDKYILVVTNGVLSVEQISN